MNKNYWENRYVNKETGWDIGYASPPLIEYCKQIENKSTKILIPGAGNSYEVDELINMGFENIYVCDIASTPIQNLKDRLMGKVEKIKIYHSDFFQLSDTFDLIIEQTFFCALDPNLRNSYVQKVYDLLRPTGKIIGLLFSSQFSFEGPPYGGTYDEYIGLFDRKFDIHSLSPCKNSIPPRLGNELFFIFRKSRYNSVKS